MYRTNPRQIDKLAIKNATWFAKQRIEHHRIALEEMTKDPRKEARLKDYECPPCFYSSRIGGAAITTGHCSLCTKIVSSGDTNLPTLCLGCAQLNKLCTHCAGDIDCKYRNKPYELKISELTEGDRKEIEYYAEQYAHLG